LPQLAAKLATTMPRRPRSNKNAATVARSLKVFKAISSTDKIYFHRKFDS
jgi:hypothetical protein